MAWIILPKQYFLTWLLKFMHYGKLAIFQLNRLNHYSLLFSLWSASIKVKILVFFWVEPPGSNTFKDIAQSCFPVILLLQQTQTHLACARPFIQRPTAKLQLNTLYLQGTKHWNKRAKISPEGAKTGGSIYSWYFRFQFLHIPSGPAGFHLWLEGATPALSTLPAWQSKANRLSLSFQTKASPGKRKKLSPCLEPSWGFLTLAASPPFPLAHISSTGSFFPTGFLQALFYFTQNQLSNTNASHPCECLHFFLQTILEAQLNFCSPALPVLFGQEGITAFLLSVQVRIW